MDTSDKSDTTTTPTGRKFAWPVDVVLLTEGEPLFDEFGFEVVHPYRSGDRLPVEVLFSTTRQEDSTEPFTGLPNLVLLGEGESPPALRLWYRRDNLPDDELSVPRAWFHPMAQEPGLRLMLEGWDQVSVKRTMSTGSDASAASREVTIHLPDGLTTKGVTHKRTLWVDPDFGGLAYSLGNNSYVRVLAELNAASNEPNRTFREVLSLLPRATNESVNPIQSNGG